MFVMALGKKKILFLLIVNYATQSTQLTFASFALTYKLIRI